MAPKRRRPLAATQWMLLLAAAAVLVPVSSFLGVRGWTGEWLWIWQPSMAANLLFTVGTAGAFVAAVQLGRSLPPAPGVLAAIVAGGLLHWLVYAWSWSLVLAADGSQDFADGAFGFVAMVGVAGLSFVATAGGAAVVALASGDSGRSGPVTSS